ncbi:NUDIX hydrolase [Halobaculum litoreum]|uniref:NUDIX hydrolase n=1 Tax=Halobaculum litoreum TaxID=3031998 RepID=A0ABD5Y1C5_9EURY
MNVEKKTREEVSRRIDRLQERYGPFPVHEETVENNPDYFKQGEEMAEEGWIGDAGAWITDDADRVLLIRHEGSPNEWGIPGGGHKPGETMEETTRREVREETGVECTITGVNYARRKTIVLTPNPDERYYMLTVIFNVEYDGGSISISDEEVLEAKWFSEPPENVLDLVEEHVSTWDSH